MSSTELERLALMQRIAERRTTQRVVAEQLGLSLRENAADAPKPASTVDIIVRQTLQRFGEPSRVMGQTRDLCSNFISGDIRPRVRDLPRSRHLT